MNEWIRLANLQLPPRMASSLLDRFGEPASVFDAAIHDFADLPGMTEKQASRILDPTFAPTSHQLEFMERANVTVITRASESFPRNLKDIPDPPPVLFVRGEMIEKDRFAVAVVGSRHASPYG